jgi:hypothetical protein
VIIVLTLLLEILAGVNDIFNFLLFFSRAIFVVCRNLFVELGTGLSVFSKLPSLFDSTINIAY